jgi:hypothetical protein
MGKRKPKRRPAPNPRPIVPNPAPTDLRPFFDRLRTVSGDVPFDEAVKAFAEHHVAASAREAERLGIFAGPLAEEAKATLREGLQVAEARARAFLIHPDNPTGAAWEPEPADIAQAKVSLLAAYLNARTAAPRDPHEVLCRTVAQAYGLHAAAVDHALPDAWAWVQAAFEMAMTAEGEARAHAQWRVAIWRAALRASEQLPEVTA